MGPELFGYTHRPRRGEDLSFDERDSAPFMPKCRVIDPAFTWGATAAPSVPWERTIIYETHVRGFTKRHPAVARGAARHVRRPGRRRQSSTTCRALGVTAVELLPIHAFVDDSYLLDKGLTQLLGLQHDRLLRAEPRYLRDRRASPSSRRWSPTFTTPGSR